MNVVQANNEDGLDVKRGITHNHKVINDLDILFGSLIYLVVLYIYIYIYDIQGDEKILTLWGE